jgi:hypothetical protein
MLANSFDGGVAGASLAGDDSSGGGTPFDVVVTSGGSSLTYDSTHAMGTGLSARHAVGDRENAYYGWSTPFGERPILKGRVYVWFDALPRQDLRLVRAVDGSSLRWAIDVLAGGRVRVRDGANRTLVTSAIHISTGAWVRLEWTANHRSGTFALSISNDPSRVVTRTTTSGPGRSIGPSVGQVQIGRSGTQKSSATFWTENPALWVS